MQPVMTEAHEELIKPLLADQGPEVPYRIMKPGVQYRFWYKPWTWFMSNTVTTESEIVRVDSSTALTVKPREKRFGPKGTSNYGQAGRQKT